MRLREMKVQCGYVYPIQSRERGRRCERMVGAKTKTGLCPQHVTCGWSQRATTVHIVIERDWNVWKGGE